MVVQAYDEVQLPRTYTQGKELVAADTLSRTALEETFRLGPEKDVEKTYMLCLLSESKMPCFAGSLTTSKQIPSLKYCRSIRKKLGPTVETLTVT